MPIPILMNFVDNTDLLSPYMLWGNSFISKISQIVNICESSQNLMIGIYLIEKNRFLFCNYKLKEILAESYNHFLRDGWDFWYSLVNPNEKASIKNLITTFCTYPYSQNQLTVKYHITDFHGNKICIKHELLLHQLERHFVAKR